jgi:hypothetical protein
LLVVILAGLCIGFAPVPLKRMRSFEYPHWAFVAMLTGLIVVPWAITLLACPDAWGGLRSVGPGVLLKANLFSIGWGIANILFLQCLVRIGVSLTSGIVGGMTIALGVLVPMVFKGTGAFHDAPAIGSASGWAVLAGVAIALLGVFLAARAGVSREARGSAQLNESSRYATGLVMAITAGLLGSGISFAFVYSQGPIVDAMKARGAGDGAANVSVWAAALLGGALANVLYPAFLMTRNKSWSVLGQNPREVVLAAVLGVAFIAGFSLLGKGMLLLGVLGASVGFGVQQSVQMLGNQAVGFAYGEWRDSSAVAMYCALGLLILAIGILSVGNSLAHS